MGCGLHGVGVLVLASVVTCAGGFAALDRRSVVLQPHQPAASSPATFLTTPTPLPSTGRVWGHSVRLDATLSSSSSAVYSQAAPPSAVGGAASPPRSTGVTAGADEAVRGLVGTTALPPQVLSAGFVDLIEEKFYVNLLSYYIHVQQNLTEHLGRKPSMDEWALCLNVPAQDLQHDLVRSQAIRSSLVERHMKLVRGIAKTYRGRGLSYQDLVQEGVCGVIHAAERFEPSRGIMFSTYAKHWIRQHISRAVARHSRMIRLPQRVHERVVTMARVKSDMHAQLGRDPTVQEIALSARLSADKVKSYTHISQSVSSLDQTRRSAAGKANRDASATLSLQDVVVDRSHPCPEQHTDRNLLRDELLRLLDQLPELEKKVISLRFGLMDGRPKTHEEVFEELTHSGVSSQKCVRLAENRALYKLRKPYKRPKTPPVSSETYADTVNRAVPESVVGIRTELQPLQGKKASDEEEDTSRAESTTLLDHKESYNDYVAIYPYNV